jgi:tryptophan synthase beta chain
MEKKRILCETGAGQHGVATATACALLGLECTVYMGAVDAARQRMNLLRMELLGARVVVVEHGQKTLKDAINEALRAWVADPIEAHYVLGSALGPHPFPSIVAGFQEIIGREARAQSLDESGRLPDLVVACVGGGSNAIGIFRAFLDDPSVDLVGVEAGGEGAREREARGALRGGSPGVLHGCYTYRAPDEEGRSLPTHSVSAGSTTPRSVRSTRAARESGRAVPVLHGRGRARRLRGARAARGNPHRRSRARTRSAGSSARRRRSAGRRVLVNLSGRGDKDLETVAALRRASARVDDRRSASRAISRLRPRPAEKGLAPYVTAGDGGLETTLAVLRALAQVGGVAASSSALPSATRSRTARPPGGARRRARAGGDVRRGPSRCLSVLPAEARLPSR